jgi:uncharacterized membrane protein
MVASKSKSKTANKKSSNTKSSNKEVSNKLDKILSVENQLLRTEREVEKKEEILEQEEKRIELEEKRIENKEKDFGKIDKILEKEEDDIKKLERIEEEIKAEVGEHPLAKVTLKDVAKGFIGAFIGLAIHYTFVYGVEIAENKTMTRATILFPLTFIVGLLFIYATGFRKIQDKKILVYMPIRLGVLYACSLIMSVVVLFLFYPSFGHTFEESYKMVAAVMLAAIVGACTADLLGKE